MNANQLKTAIAKVLHDKPRHITVPAAVLGVIVAMALAHVAITAHQRSQEHAAPAVAAQVSTRTPAPAAKPAQIEPVASSKPVVAQIAPPAASPAKVKPASSTSGLSVVAAQPIATPAPAAPPPGVAAGWLQRETLGQDQFQQWTPTSPAEPVKLAGAEVIAPSLAAGDPQRRTVWTGWIDLPSATTVAALDVNGGAGTVSATVDSWSIGPQVSRALANDDPSTQTATIALAAGWHKLQIAAQQRPNAWTGASGDLHIRVQFGNADALATPTVYAVPDSKPAVSAGGAK